MPFRNLLHKYRTAEALLARYESLYYYQVDYYQVDEVNFFYKGREDYDTYLDWVVSYFVAKEKVTIPVRIFEWRQDEEEANLGKILSTGFSIGVLDKVLRDYGISVRVGDVVASAGVFDELANLKDYSQLVKPVFVRLVQRVEPHVYILQGNNVLEWRLQVSDTDVVFRYYA